METRANSALVGAFTLVVLVVAALFVYWLERGTSQNNNLPISVIFNDPVNGLSVGGQVVFNGIKVGDVKGLRLDPQHPGRVIADLGVASTTPVKKDTNVALGFAGLTGVGYVDLSAGSPTAPSIWADNPNPTIVAQRSSIQDLMAGARTILSTTKDTLSAVQKLVDENSGAIHDSIDNVRTLTQSLAQNSGQIGDFMSNASTAAKSIADVSNKLHGIVDRVQGVADAIDPEKIRGTVDSVNSLAQSLGRHSEDIDAIVTRLSTVSSDVSAFTARLPTVAQKVETIVDAVDPGKISHLVDRFDQITSAIDPERIRATVNGISTVAQTLGDHKADIDTLVTNLSAASRDFAAFTPRLPSIGDNANTLLANANKVVASIDERKVGDTVDSIHTFAGTLRDNSQDITTIVANVKATSQRLDEISQKANALLGNLNTMTGPQNGQTNGLIQQARETLASIKTAADTFNVQVKGIGAGVDKFSTRGYGELQGLVGQTQRTVTHLDSVITDLQQNPSQFLLHGDRAPTYNGQRH
ncbi:phospholipid/cholesterol/gamma-HCH transport system substrate-binding protein [Faunimonas pinastri]|uniref:Phospholipid/cholesterol/gamma-HCH transport system substrate-binding protein n=1 Tax=Faunimonas pinastri TaxID=1855383 RepID=A0A1H9FBL5_9HYPH|nr:MlaD family protein [Faunimonas pinastri]SEQ35341.1 phospholipid/cholesterol/gamma-HCH transport system substrate-binding protein [Faunimonas pinastri]